MNLPSITVVIPNRNDAVPLRKCLASVRALDVPPDEVVIVDDCSTDDSCEIIRDAIRDMPTATLVVNERWSGTMASLNEGLRRATSDYVLFLSSNDLLQNGIFRHAKTCLQRHGWPGVWSALVMSVDAEGNGQRLYPSPVISRDDHYLSPESCIRLAHRLGHWFTGTTLLYNREELTKLGGFDPAYQGLADMIAALSLASLRGASFSPQSFGIMRMHEGGLMWRTLIDLPGLDVILQKMSRDGAVVSPALFSAAYSDLMTRRVRFTAIRTIPDLSWMDHARGWSGARYRVVVKAAGMLGNWRPLVLLIAFVSLRPAMDILAILWYRFGANWLIRAAPRFSALR